MFILVSDMENNPTKIKCLSVILQFACAGTSIFFPYR